MKSFTEYLEEQQSLMEYEYSVDDDGNAIDDEGNRFRSSRGAGVYGLRDRSYHSYRYTSRPRPVKFKTGENIKWVSDDEEIVKEFISELDSGYPITYSKRLTAVFDAVKKSCKNIKFTSVPKVASAGYGVLTDVCVTSDTELTISKKDFADIIKATFQNEESFENMSDNDWKAMVEKRVHNPSVAFRLFNGASESIDSVLTKLKLKPVFRACDCRSLRYEVRVKGDTITICGKNAALWESEKLGTNLYKIMTNYLPTKLWAKFFKRNPHLSKR